MTSGDIEGIKAVLDVHMEQIRRELIDLKKSYGDINREMNTISNQTGIALTKMQADINHIGAKVNANMEEINAVKTRLEFHEDVQVEKWNDQGKLNDTQKAINESSREASKRKLDTRTALFVGGIATVITIIITRLADLFFSLL